MKLITDPDNSENTIGFISDRVLFGFDKHNRPVQIGPIEQCTDAVRIIKEWQAKQLKN